MNKRKKCDWDALRLKLEKVDKLFSNQHGMGHYILNDKGEPVAAKFSEWAIWFERRRTKRILKQQWIGNVRVSTVFLGLDHSWGKGPPVLWETMTFSNRKDFDQRLDRCAGSREQAQAMHARVCAEVREKLGMKANK